MEATPEHASRTALITGASSGIGAETARVLAAAGFDCVLAARRIERCRALADEIGGRAIALDVTDADAVARLAGELERCDVIVHSAGGALGLAPVAEADDGKWLEMYETNVLGVERVTKALLPALERGGNGHVVVIGSVSGVEVYPGGAGYTAAKHAVNALCRTLRLELLGKPIRVTEVAPGIVETEFSVVRFDGDSERAAAVYDGITPLSATDVAEAVAFAVTRPAHVNIDYLAIMPIAQASAMIYHRE